MSEQVDCDDADIIIVAFGASSRIARSAVRAAREAVAEAARLGLEIVALETDPDAPLLGECEWPERGVLAIGNEELGLEPAALEASGRRVRIPMYGRKASMNVANAFALAAWEIRRARERRTPSGKA